MQIFIKINLRQVYYQIRIKEGDKQKAAFRLQEGLYKLLIMQFRLTNILVIFQKRINSVLGEHLNEFIMVYLNNIIIYLISKEEHGEYVKQVLKRLQEEQMPVVIKKYEFFTRKTNFIGFIIKLDYISMDLKKVKAIVNW